MRQSCTPNPWQSGLWFFCPISDGNMTESYFERLLTSLCKKGKLISSLWRSGSQPAHPSLLLHIAPSKIKLLRQPLESQALDVGTDRCLGDYWLILLCRFFLSLCPEAIGWRQRKDTSWHIVAVSWGFYTFVLCPQSLLCNLLRS